MPAVNHIKADVVEPASLEQVRVVEGGGTIRERYGDYLSDESRYGEGLAERIFFPQSEAEVVAVVRWAADTGTALTISGGRTGLTGGAVPLGGALLSLERMDNMLALGFDDERHEWYLRAQPGVTLERLNRAVRTKQLEELRGKGTPSEQEALERFLKEPKSYFFPPDPTEMTAQLGGAVAANASGARTFKYGPMRRWVRRLRVVLANGDVLDIHRGAVTAKEGRFLIELSDGRLVEVPVPRYRMPATRKNAAGLYAKPGMDLIDLFIGSEGILGVITEVEVRLAPAPERFLTIFAFLPSEEAAIRLVKDLRSPNSPIQPELIEYLDGQAVQMLREARARGTSGVTVPAQVETCQVIVFFEVAFSEQDMEKTFTALQELLSKHGLGMEDTWAGIDQADLDRMKAVRHLIPETVNSIIAQRKQQHPAVHKLGTDMAVPDEHLETMLAYYRQLLDEAGMDYLIFGHIGDNHLHVNILPRDEEEVRRGMAIYHRFAQKAVELGGTVSAEHGIGKLKRPFLQVMYGEQGLEEMARVKGALDPKWILNPGNMIPRPGETIPPLNA